jgi:hypothetical protein
MDGEEAHLLCHPLLPPSHPRIEQRSEAEFDAERRESPIILSTACWRGYQGTWKIEDNQFFLIELRGRLRLVGDHPLLADWITTTIAVSSGEFIRTYRIGFYALYEQEIHFKVERGIITASRTIDNRGRDPDSPYSDWDVHGVYRGPKW